MRKRQSAAPTAAGVLFAAMAKVSRTLLFTRGNRRRYGKLEAEGAAVADGVSSDMPSACTIRPASARQLAFTLASASGGGNVPIGASAAKRRRRNQQAQG